MFTLTFGMDPKDKRSEKRPTLMDVAREAGVSHMTVSRVVRGSHQVRPDTCQRVERAIKQLGYQPDPTMSALAAYRMQGKNTRGEANLAFLDRDESPYSAKVYEGLQDEARLHGYSVERHVLMRDEKQQKQLARMLVHRGVRGLLFGPSNVEWTYSGWDWNEFAMLSLGAITHNPVMHSVCIQYFEAALNACHMALDSGAKRIGFAVEPRLERRTGHQWLGGYTAALAARELHVYRGEWPVGQSFKQWSRRNRLDAILCVNPQLLNFWTGQRSMVYMLNDDGVDTMQTINRYYLDPRQIGSEGVRFLHHLLLRREYGLPERSKVTVLNGVWLRSSQCR